MTDLSRDPYYVRLYLSDVMGRVRSRVEELGHDPGPGGRTGSIIGGGNPRSSDALTDEGNVPKILELAIALIEWRGKGIGTASEKVKQNLVETILRAQKGDQYPRSDTEYVLGNPKDKATGHLEEARRIAHGLVSREEPSEEALDRTLGLINFLVDWLGTECAHSFTPHRVGDDTFHVCRCEAAFRSSGQHTWIPVSQGELNWLEELAS